MKALIKKELISMKPVLKSYLSSIAMFLLIGAFTKNISFITMMVGIIPSNHIATSISYDEAFGWETFSLTLPISRKQLVLSKYISFYIIMIPLALLTMIALRIFMISDSSSMIENYISLYLVLYLLSIMSFVMIPVSFKYGVAKSRVSIFLVLGIFFLGGFLISKYFSLDRIIEYLESNALRALIISLLVYFTGLLISLGFSIKIYENKDF